MKKLALTPPPQIGRNSVAALKYMISSGLHSSAKVPKAVGINTATMGPQFMMMLLESLGAGKPFTQYQGRIAKEVNKGGRMRSALPKIQARTEKYSNYNGGYMDKNAVSMAALKALLASAGRGTASFGRGFGRGSMDLLRMGTGGEVRGLPGDLVGKSRSAYRVGMAAPVVAGGLGAAYGADRALGFGGKPEEESLVDKYSSVRAEGFMAKCAQMKAELGEADPEHRHSALKSILKAIALTGAGALLGGGIGASRGLGKIQQMATKIREVPSSLKGILEKGMSMTPEAEELARAEALIHMVRNTGGGAAIGGAAGLGTSVVSDAISKQSFYVQGLMDKCAEQGIDAEQLVIKLAGGDADTWYKNTEHEKSEMEYRNAAAAELARQKKSPPPPPPATPTPPKK